MDLKSSLSLFCLQKICTKLWRFQSNYRRLLYKFFRNTFSDSPKKSYRNSPSNFSRDFIWNTSKVFPRDHYKNFSEGFSTELLQPDLLWDSYRKISLKFGPGISTSRDFTRIILILFLFSRISSWVVFTDSSINFLNYSKIYRKFL